MIQGLLIIVRERFIMKSSLIQAFVMYLNYVCHKVELFYHSPDGLV